MMAVDVNHAHGLVLSSWARKKKLLLICMQGEEDWDDWVIMLMIVFKFM